MIAATLGPGNSIHEGKAYENAPNCSFAICILGAGSSIAVRDGARARKYGKFLRHCCFCVPRDKLHNYLFDAFGPYPIAGALIVAGIDQAKTSPPEPEWGQGAGAFGERVGSNFGIAAITTTTRYGLAEAFREDTLYYQCECKGVFRRLGHAVISTLTARRGDDGHRDFSVPALVSPYAGTMTAVYGWYPNRYGYKDAFRMGNYTLLGLLVQNVATEFLYGGPHSLLSRSHLNKSHGASNPGANN